MMSPLVTPRWLAAHLGAPDLAVVDATLVLPHQTDRADAFAHVRIPGARRFDIDVIADPETDLPHMVPTPGRFARLVGALGIGTDTRVVFYDQQGLFSAPRGWWMMRLFGNDRASVLDGGLPAWRAGGHTVETGPPSAAEPRLFRPAYRSALLRGLGDLCANLDSQAELVLDARAAGRFSGTLPEPRAGLRGGHIPGATSLPYTDLLAADATLLAAEALRLRFARAGVDGTQPIVNYCGSGVTAAILTLGLAVAGLPIGGLYDGSWSEWGSRPDTPVES